MNNYKPLHIILKFARATKNGTNFKTQLCLLICNTFNLICLTYFAYFPS